MSEQVEASFGLLFFKKVADGLYIIGTAAVQVFGLAVRPARNMALPILLTSPPSLARIMLRRHALVSSNLALGADFFVQRRLVQAREWLSQTDRAQHSWSSPGLSRG